MDRFLTMRAFIKVVDTGGFAAAARDMGLSRSVVNKYVIALENQLGTQLLRRSSRKVSPTEAGTAFYDRALSIVNELDEAFVAVAQLQEKPRGNLRINGPMTFGALHLAPMLGDFMALYPDVHVELVLNDRFVDPIEEGFDVTVRIADVNPSTSLITRSIVGVQRVVCASPRYLESHGEPSDPKELRLHRCLHYGYQGTGSQWRLSGPRGEISSQVNCVLWSNNGDALKQVALQHQGIALLPTFIVGDELRAGTLRTILNDWHPPDISLSALYPRHRHLSAKTRLLVDFLVEKFGNRPHWDFLN